MAQHSAIVKKIVFCLLLFSRQPVQPLETGYEYPRNELIENDRLYEDLKCAYLFSGLTHMLIARIVIGPAYNIPTKLTAGNVSYYKYTVKYQLGSLYGLGVKRMGSLWLLYLYINLVPGLPKYSKDTRTEYLKLIATHEYVINKMRKDLTECRRGNFYDRYNSVITSKPNPTKEDLRDMANENDRTARGLLNKNEVYASSFVKEFKDKIKLKRLFMNNIGKCKISNKDLMNAFNVQVKWSGDITDRLEKSHFDARSLDWSADNLQHIKSYYTVNYSFYKIIMLRLTLKHMTYLKDYAGSDILYARYTQEWYNVVKEFGSILNLTDDPHVDHLLAFINKLISGTEKIESVESYVLEILHWLCLPLGCTATEPFNIDNKEFRIPYETSTNFYLSRLKNITTSRVPIEYNSLENTRIFLLYLGRVFDGVDFNVIRSMLEFIDEIKLETDMERFINVHLDFLDS